ncbi:MAG: NAD(P)-dependent oxidoreductase [Pseudomonadota bacterium]
MITGAAGFIGTLLCRKLAKEFSIITIDRNPMPKIDCENQVHIKGDITDLNFIKDIFNQYSPDVIVHCAALSSQSLFHWKSSNHYETTNVIATENICRQAALVNPNVFFIFLSSISVYGEKQTNKRIKEIDTLDPTSDYAKSKRDAEIRLKKLFDDGIVQKVDTLRLAPVYNSEKLSCIEKRVLAPIKMAFIRFGSGEQKISVLAGENLADFLLFRINQMPLLKTHSIFNVCDKMSCSFNQIITILQKSGCYPNSIIIRIPLRWIWILTRLLGFVLTRQAKWIHSWYDKLSKDFIFDNQEILSTGFLPKYDLESIFRK